jgi:hypothetical protein
MHRDASVLEQVSYVAIRKVMKSLLVILVDSNLLLLRSGPVQIHTWFS